jgi:hypothetical protein
MKNLKVTFLLTGVLALLATIPLVLAPGCASKIDQRGVYGSGGNSPFGTNDNSFMLASDKTLVDTRDTLSAFLTWELQNRQVLAGVAPNVTGVADNIRDQAPLWFTNAYVARAAYIAAFKANPSTAGPASNAFAASVSALSAQSAAVKTITNSVKLH